MWHMAPKRLLRGLALFILRPKKVVFIVTDTASHRWLTEDIVCVR